MLFPKGLWIFIGVSLLLCSIGFHRFVWFMSVGYGLSAAGIGAALLVYSLVNHQFTILSALQCVVMVVYGFRLGGFLLIRELKNEKYRAKASEVGLNMNVPFFVSIFMWLYCGFFYVFQSASPVYRQLNGATGKATASLLIGVVISALGVYMEATADKQKSAAKELNPNMPAMTGLFKLCRCPNYFGEMLFWTGTFVSGFGVLQGAQWIFALIGYAEIMFVMISGAKRVETRHIKHYGNSEEYNHYADTTPLLIPFVPLYHMTSPEKIAKEEAAKKAKQEAKAKKQ